MKSGFRYLIGLCLVASLPCVGGCWSLRIEKDESLAAGANTSDDFKPVEFTREGGMAEYQAAGITGKVEWLGCHGAAGSATFVLMHRDRAGFDAGKFCDGWIAQAFLSRGVDVVAVNRPGYGASTGSPDFAGKASLAALDAGIKAATSRFSRPFVAAWGVSTGATAAALYAKHAKTFQALILGGGVYDLEETEKQSADEYMKTDLAQIKKTGGGRALEDRSIGYDVSGLPKLIFVYHGTADKSAPFGQAKAFADSLASSEYKVKFQPIDGATDDLAWSHHRKIIRSLVDAVLAGGSLPAPTPAN